MKAQKIYNAHFDESLILSLSNELNLHKKVVEILLSRGLTTKQEIFKFINPPKQYLLNDPFDLCGMNDAVKAINSAIKEQKRILIFGDYDVDGISATFILMRAIQKLGYNCNFFLPNRFTDGYGLTCETLDKCVEKYKPNLIVTVDCGITACQEVEYAKSLGIKMVITDHHEPLDILPQCPIVNPKVPGQKYPFPSLCGTGVALKLSQALLGRDKITDEMLSVAAIATIADIVPLVDENRAITYYGLKVAQSLPVGIKEMLAEQNMSLDNVKSSDISFKISPRLNSSGRMGEAADSLFLFIEKDPEKITNQLARINRHNIKRQKLCLDIYENCVKMLTNIPIASEKCIILKNDNWDAGILGIVCARLVETYHRPVFLFAKVGDELRGSGRSIESINIHDMLSSASKYLIKFGGHSMAAGLSITEDKFADFVSAVKEYIAKNVNDQIFYNNSVYDIDIDESEVTPKLLSDLEIFEPTGNQNSKPIFKIKPTSCEFMLMKKHDEHAILKIKNMNLIYFNYLSKNSFVKYSRNPEIIFDFQAENQYTHEIDALVKTIEDDFALNEKATALQADSVFNLMRSENNGEAIYRTFKPSEIASFLYLTHKSMFGTLFVCHTLNAYNNFITKCDLSGLQNHYVGEVASGNGLNAIIYAPKSYKNFDTFSRIIFLDDLPCNLAVGSINKISKAECFVLQAHQNSHLESELTIDRKAFIEIYNLIKKYKGHKVNKNSISTLYTSSKCKYSPLQFALTLCVFAELKIIEFREKLVINETQKTELEKSDTYNYIKGLVK